MLLMKCRLRERGIGAQGPKSHGVPQVEGKALLTGLKITGRLSDFGGHTLLKAKLQYVLK